MICGRCLQPVFDPALIFSPEVGACRACAARTVTEIQHLGRIFDALIAGGIERQLANEVMTAYVEAKGGRVQ